MGHINKTTHRISQKKQPNVEKNIFCVSQYTCAGNPRRQRSANKTSGNAQVKCKGAVASSDCKPLQTQKCSIKESRQQEILLGLRRWNETQID